MKTTNQLKTVAIYRSEVKHDCETCGGAWGESYHTFYGGEQLGVHAVASCFGANNTSYAEVLEMVLHKIGYQIKVVDCYEQE